MKFGIKKKRILSLFLSLAMVIGYVPCGYATAIPQEYFNNDYPKAEASSTSVTAQFNTNQDGKVYYMLTTATTADAYDLLSITTANAYDGASIGIANVENGVTKNISITNGLTTGLMNLFAIFETANGSAHGTVKQVQVTVPSSSQDPEYFMDSYPSVSATASLATASFRTNQSGQVYYALSTATTMSAYDLLSITTANAYDGASVGIANVENGVLKNVNISSGLTAGLMNLFAIFKTQDGLHTGAIKKVGVTVPSVSSPYTLYGTVNLPQALNQSITVRVRVVNDSWQDPFSGNNTTPYVDVTFAPGETSKSYELYVPNTITNFYVAGFTNATNPNVGFGPSFYKDATHSSAVWSDRTELSRAGSLSAININMLKPGFYIDSQLNNLQLNVNQYKQVECTALYSTGSTAGSSVKNSGIISFDILSGSDVVSITSDANYYKILGLKAGTAQVRINYSQDPNESKTINITVTGGNNQQPEEYFNANYPAVSSANSSGVSFSLNTKQDGKVYYMLTTNATPSAYDMMTVTPNALDYLTVGNVDVVNGVTRYVSITSGIKTGLMHLYLMFTANNNQTQGAIKSIDLNIIKDKETGNNGGGGGSVGGGGGASTGETVTTKQSPIGQQEVRTVGGVTTVSTVTDANAFRSALSSPPAAGGMATATFNLMDTTVAGNTLTLPSEFVSQSTPTLAVIKTPIGSYSLPSTAVSPTAISSISGFVPSSILSVQPIVGIAQPPANVLGTITTAYGSSLVSPVVEFSVSASVTLTDGTTRTVPVNNFNGLVERTLPISGGSTAGLCGVVFDGFGGFRAVPTSFVANGAGGFNARILSPGNSVYGVIKLPTVTVSTDHWAAAQMNDFATKHIIEANQFKPDAKMTRADFATMLMKALGFDLGASQNVTFKDLNGVSQQTSNAIALAKKLGIVSGRGTDKFSPNDTITREEMAVMIANAKAFLPLSAKDNGKTFSDLSTANAWAKDALVVLSSNGIYNGYTDGTLKPHAEITSAEALTVVYNALNILK